MPPRPSPTETVQAPSDDELLGALATDPQWALGGLYDRYARLVYGLARAVLSSTEEAEDVTQEVFLGLCHRWQYDPARGSLAAFLVTMARSRALDKLRARGRKLRILRQSGHRLAPEPSHGDPAEEAWLSEMSRSVRAALAGLPDNQRQVLELAYYQGLSQTEIASQLETTLGTVKSWARRGLFSLRHALQDHVR
jgi:RNA polymerase sigma-70 factor (ECF subfamily)